MPIFKIEAPGSRKVMIKGHTIHEIIEKSIEKLSLLATTEYKIVLQSDGTEIDDDDVLVEYGSKQTLERLVILEKNQNYKAALLDVDENNKNSSNSHNIIEKVSESFSQCDGKGSDKQALNLNEIWKKLPDYIFETCQNQEKLTSKSRTALVNAITDYMKINLNYGSMTTSRKIATLLCTKYPLTFREAIGDEIISDGINTLLISIYNSVRYKMRTVTMTNKRKRLVDSDDEEIEEMTNEVEKITRRDEYGCLQYAPSLPKNENSKSQEAKRLKLIELFLDSNGKDDEIKSLMNDTYPTQRAVINDQVRDIQKIVSDWPFFKNSHHLINHASKLLGKDVSLTWTESLEKTSKSIRQYFKFTYRNKAISSKNESQSDSLVKKKEKINNEIEISKKACEINASVLPKTLVIFPLLMTHFDELPNEFFKIINEETEDEKILESLDSEYPILLIRGESLYDENAQFYVAVNKKFTIVCNDSLQGLLVTFICFYVFGYCYNPKMERTLEFIQRIFLKINPTKGDKRQVKSKRRPKNYDSAVYNLAKSLSLFSDDFKVQ